MILADTSVWIDHFRRGDRTLRELLEDGQVVLHPAVLGQLACGALRNRERTLADLKALPKVAEADADETLYIIESRKLWGRGIGWIDAQLLASALISGVKILTHDRQLADAAAAFGVAF